MNRLPNFSSCRSSTRHADDKRHRDVQFQRAAFQNAERLRALRRENRRTPGLENARLLRRNGFDARAEERFVIEVDRRDDRDLRVHHIGGVEPPAQPGFEHHDLNGGRSKCDERHRGHGLEKAGMRVDFFAREQTFGRRVNRFEGLAPGFSR